VEAKQIFNEKVSECGYIQEQVVWLLDTPVTGCRHLFKYRLYFGTDDGVCLIRYDNERGKGDHKHITGIEYPYTFSTMEAVFTDFIADINSILLNEG
jgi:Family of unknown function (DUF6516)